jgi:ADP-heptose:LPS heptosyltransferase
LSFLVYGTRKDNFIDWPHNHPDIDAKVAIGDLGITYRKSIDDFPGTPYLKAPKGMVEKYRKKLAKLGGRKKIGISWTGGYVKTRKDMRSIPLSLWKDILGLDADFISLQYTPDAYNEIAALEDEFDTKIHHWPLAVQAADYGETAGLVEALDLVITVNTSVHHLAGGLGKECWTLTPHAKAWRYFSSDGKTLPWYNSCKLYQQENLQAWPKIMETVKADLQVFIDGETVSSKVVPIK